MSNSPRRAAVTLVVKRAVICPARLLRRGMKSDVTDVGSSAQRHAKGLDRTIQVLVIQRILVVVNTSRRVGHFVTHKPDPVVSRIRLHLIDRRARPCHDSRLHPDCGRGGRKRKTRCAGDVELAIRHVVIHVALIGM